MTTFDSLNNKLLLYFFQLSPMASLVLKPECDAFIVADVNNAYLTLMNVDQNELLGKDILTFFENRIISKGDFSFTNSLYAVVKNKVKNVSVVEPFQFNSKNLQDNLSQYW